MIAHRKVVQVSTALLWDHHLDEKPVTWIVTTALCDDGTLWRMGYSDEWTQLPSVPGALAIHD